LGLENVAAALDGRKLDYLIVDHMEPDHAAMIEAVLVRWPDLRLVVNAKTLPMLKMYFPTDSAAFDDALVVKEGDTLDLGKHKLTFVMAPMVHWPEVMMTFDTTTGTLFSWMRASTRQRLRCCQCRKGHAQQPLRPWWQLWRPGRWRRLRCCRTCCRTAPWVFHKAAWLLLNVGFAFCFSLLAYSCNFGLFPVFPVRPSARSMFSITSMSVETSSASSSNR